MNVINVSVIDIYMLVSDCHLFLVNQLKAPSLTDEKNLVSEQIKIVRMSLKPLPNLFYSCLAC